MWTVLYIATSRSVAQRIKDYMEAEGILVRLNPLGIKVKENNANFEVLVTEAELEEAQEVLNQALQVKEYREIR
ncbi:MAG TPA: glutamate decarboxylase [Firmicutes bacterium]|nr:glutamate decarboxylase [Bacillota bacterium]